MYLIVMHTGDHNCIILLLIVRKEMQFTVTYIAIAGNSHTGICKIHGMLLAVHEILVTSITLDYSPTTSSSSVCYIHERHVMCMHCQFMLALTFL